MRQVSGDERWAGEVGVSERGGVSVSGRGGVLVSGYDGGGGVSWWVIGGGVDEDGVEGGCGYKRGGGDSWWVTVHLVAFACSRSPTLVHPLLFLLTCPPSFSFAFFSPRWGK